MKTLSPALQELEYYGVENLLYWFEYPIRYVQQLESELNDFYLDAEKIELCPWYDIKRSGIFFSLGVMSYSYAWIWGLIKNLNS